MHVSYLIMFAILLHLLTVLGICRLDYGQVQYELFRLKEDEDIETLFSSFQTLLSGLQVLNKIYIVIDHV